MSKFTGYRDHVGASPTTFFKSTLFQSERRLPGLICLEPGQEQHAYLSLSTNSILAERVAAEAAEAAPAFAVNGVAFYGFLALIPGWFVAVAIWLWKLTRTAAPHRP